LSEIQQEQISKATEEGLKKMEENTDYEKEDYEKLQQEIEDVVGPIMKELHAASGMPGGMPGGMPDMETQPSGEMNIEEVD